MHRVFDQLDRWRHLPAYQLERRADIFFAVYLSDFLTDKCGVKFKERVIPEFPIRQAKTHLSDKADYLLIAEDSSQAVFVELKTDTESFRGPQCQYLANACNIKLGGHVTNVMEIAEHSKQARKYRCLLSELAGLLCPEVKSLPTDKLKVLLQSACSQQIKNTTIEIVYVAPQLPADAPPCGKVILFAELTEWLRNRVDDGLAQRFADSLERWVELPAGGR